MQKNKIAIGANEQKERNRNNILQFAFSCTDSQQSCWSGCLCVRSISRRWKVFTVRLQQQQFEQVLRYILFFRCKMDCMLKRFGEQNCFDVAWIDQTIHHNRIINDNQVHQTNRLVIRCNTLAGHIVCRVLESWANHLRRIVHLWIFQNLTERHQIIVVVHAKCHQRVAQCVFNVLPIFGMLHFDVICEWTDWHFLELATFMVLLQCINQSHNVWTERFEILFRRCVHQTDTCFHIFYKSICQNYSSIQAFYGFASGK